MSEHAGSSVAAIRAHQSVLASRHRSAADADRVLAEALAAVHAATRESVRRLDAIAEEIDRAALDQADLAADTPLGARELHNFLSAKLREIRAVVADAHELSRMKSTVLEGLRAAYGAPNG
ncbi:DUF4226 domain-containing protein [Mycobacterium sp. THU-M104]|uniref:DUF4226 domain-containing protein n=1 Tax=Mycobacterium sp. THU-M104 TaxID=3410515 RepID=UPI003B9B003E